MNCWRNQFIISYEISFIDSPHIVSFLNSQTCGILAKAVGPYIEWLENAINSKGIIAIYSEILSELDFVSSIMMSRI